jgi:hypothetical protein
MSSWSRFLCMLCATMVVWVSVELVDVPTAHAQDYLQVQDPQNFGGRYIGTIDEATLTVRPRGVYIEYGLFLTFSAKGSAYINTPYYAKTNLETVMNFTLPTNSMLTDSWLWVGDSVMRAQILDRWTASSIYDL